MINKNEPESVWDYPRPPRMEETPRRLRIVQAGIVLAETCRSLRILETSHPPVYYIPPSDIAMEHMQTSPRRNSFCEWKGLAIYWNIVIGNAITHDAAWSYPNPVKRYAALRDHIAFYANHVDECWVEDERVHPQPGDFYGGWITSHVRGPFKGAPGTLGW